MKAALLLLLMVLFFDNCISYIWRDLECIPYLNKRPQTMFDIITETSPSTKPDIRKEVKFYLFTRKNLECFQELKMNDTDRLKLSHFSSYWPTRIIIHGWMNNLYSRMNRLIKTAYLRKGNFNVIIVDWGNLASDISYHRASKVVDEIGTLIAEFTKFLHNTISVSLNDIYLIGHSLGAQIAGSAGLQSQGKFNTIFVLDPAGLNFEESLNKSKITMASAKYVEAIHTDMGLLGADYPIGHASFFPNYGKNQPGCSFFRSCSHSRAYLYFSESINTDIGFWATPCKNIKDIFQMRCTPSGRRVLMGGEPATKKEGYFYLPTNGRAFFARGYRV